MNKFIPGELYLFLIRNNPCIFECVRKEYPADDYRYGWILQLNGMVKMGANNFSKNSRRATISYHINKVSTAYKYMKLKGIKYG